MRIYWAAALFTTAERMFNVAMANAILGYASGTTIRLPQEELPSQDIYDQNMADLINCDMVIAVVDGPDTDSGTAFEVGYAVAMNKKVWLVRTDFRMGGDAEDSPINLMLDRAASARFWFDSREIDVQGMGRMIAGALNRG